MAMNTSVMICVSCFNRKPIAELCLPTIGMGAAPEDRLFLFDDGSTEYPEDFLEQWGDVVSHGPNIGIEAQRRNHLTSFWHSDFSHLYFTDADAPHDPYWREIGMMLQAQHKGAPVCLYDTQAHVDLVGNTISDEFECNVIWRRVAPGISYLLTRKHVETIMPRIKELTNFDWQIPEWLGGRFAVSRKSYVDHIGKGGMHDPKYEGFDGGDRCLNPTFWLETKRTKIVEKLSQP